MKEANWETAPGHIFQSWIHDSFPLLSVDHITEMIVHPARKVKEIRYIFEFGNNNLLDNTYFQTKDSLLEKWVFRKLSNLQIFSLTTCIKPVLPRREEMLLFASCFIICLLKTQMSSPIWMLVFQRKKAWKKPKIILFTTVVLVWTFPCTLAFGRVWFRCSRNVTC